MKLALFLVGHWYLGLFVQSFFLHRYIAHQHFSMSRFWERFFFVINFLTFGSSYMCPRAFGEMHTVHHAHSDAEKDPHSPLKTPNLFKTILQARNNYRSYYIKQKTNGSSSTMYPHWENLDRIAHNWVTRVVWIFLYILIYSAIVTDWLQYLFLPITVMLGALQGGIVNYWAHKFGYRNYDIPDNSRNIFRLDILFLGEAYHNNHHKFPHKVNTAQKWYEFDLTYHLIKIFDKIGIIRVRNRSLQKSKNISQNKKSLHLR